MRENIANMHERATRFMKALDLCLKPYPDQTRILYHAWIATFNSLCALPSLEKDGQVSYSRNADNDTDARRVRTSFGRFVRRQWAIEPAGISDAILADIGTKVTAAIGTIKIERLTGDDLSDAYGSDSVHTCMSGQTDCIAVYAENPESVSLLAHRNSAGIVDARALLWTMQADNGEKLYLDREYGNPVLIDAIRTEAKLLGAELRGAGGRRQAYWTEPVTINGLRIPSTSKMPYMDSLSHGEVYKNRLTLSTNYGAMQFSDTGGGYIGQCESCGEWFFGDAGSENCNDCGNLCCAACGRGLSEDDCHSNPQGASVYVYCESCFSDRFFCCDDCAEYRDRDDYAFSDRHGSFCTDHAHQCRECDEWTRDSLDDFGRCSDCTIACANCGKAVESADELYGEDTDYCADCVNACVHCGAWIDPASSSRTPTQCADCAAVNLFAEQFQETVTA